MANRDKLSSPLRNLNLGRAYLFLLTSLQYHKKLTFSSILEHAPVSISANGVSYTTTDIVGRGSFGVVFKALCDADNTTVAIKKVLQDRRFKVIV